MRSISVGEVLSQRRTQKTGIERAMGTIERELGG